MNVIHRPRLGSILGRKRALWILDTFKCIVKKHVLTSTRRGDHHDITRQVPIINASSSCLEYENASDIHSEYSQSDFEDGSFILETPSSTSSPTLPRPRDFMSLRLDPEFRHLLPNFQMSRSLVYGRWD
jgi:hypothetical protein